MKKILLTLLFVLSMSTYCYSFGDIADDFRDDGSNLSTEGGDQYKMEMQCTTDGSDPTLRSAVFWIKYLHE